jgi:hypothetical protein
MRRSTRVFAFLASLAAPLAAQRSTRCALPDTTQEWFTLQRSWLDDSKHDWSNDSLRQALVKAAGVDLSHPLAVQRGWVNLDDPAPPLAEGSAILRAHFARGAVWPTKSVVGAAGVYAVWLIALRDPSVEVDALHHILEAGPGESFEPEAATLEDRVRVHAGRGQLYGTQLKAGADGKWAPVRIEDSTHVDLRRDGAWLPPLAQAICVAGR